MVRVGAAEILSGLGAWADITAAEIWSFSGCNLSRAYAQILGNTATASPLSTRERLSLLALVQNRVQQTPNEGAFPVFVDLAISSSQHR